MNGSVQITARIGGTELSKTITEQGDHASIFRDIPLPAGKLVTSWVKTDADTAACVLPGGHGYSTGKFDVYWSDGMRYDVDGTVSTNALSLDGGTGDDYPASAAEDVVVCARTEISVMGIGDNFSLLVMVMTCLGSFYFEDTLGNPIAQFSMQAEQPYLFNAGSGLESPLKGVAPVNVCYASNGTQTAGTATILILDDSTPEA